MTLPAVAYCEEVTRRRARNFWYGIRLLPVPKRQALAAVYAMSRRIDDAGDDGLPAPEAHALLDSVEASFDRLDTACDDPVVAALAVAAERFPIRMDAFRDLVAGVRMDLDATRYGSFDELVVYCRRVAGSVGRLSLSVFGTADPSRAEPLADDLGVAMQLTNILRDVREDLGRGRVYLPAEDLLRFGCSGTDLDGTGGEAVRALIRFEAERAEDWFRRGLRLLLLLDRRSAACAGAMAGIYRRLLRRIAARPDTVVRERLSLPAWEKALVAVRALTGSSVPRPAPARRAAA